MTCFTKGQAESAFSLASTHKLGSELLAPDPSNMSRRVDVRGKPGPTKRRFHTNTSKEFSEQFEGIAHSKSKCFEVNPARQCTQSLGKIFIRQVLMPSSAAHVLCDALFGPEHSASRLDSLVLLSCQSRRGVGGGIVCWHVSSTPVLGVEGGCREFGGVAVGMVWRGRLFNAHFGAVCDAVASEM